MEAAVAVANGEAVGGNRLGATTQQRVAQQTPGHATGHSRA